MTGNRIAVSPRAHAIYQKSIKGPALQESDRVREADTGDANFLNISAQNVRDNGRKPKAMPVPPLWAFYFDAFDLQEWTHNQQGGDFEDAKESAI